MSGRKTRTSAAPVACINRKSDVTTDFKPAENMLANAVTRHVRGLIVYPSSMAVTTAIDSDTPVSSGAGRTSHADWHQLGLRLTYEGGRGLARRRVVPARRGVVYLESIGAAVFSTHRKLEERAPRHGDRGEHEPDDNAPNRPEMEPARRERGVHPPVEDGDRDDDREGVSAVGQCRCWGKLTPFRARRSARPKRQYLLGM